MANYKPKSKELKIAKEISRLMANFRKVLGCCKTPTSAAIHIDFTLEGVRTNGTQSVTGLYDVKKDLEEYRESCQSKIRDHEKAIKRVDAMLSKLQGFKTCSKCKGEKGGRTGSVPRGYRYGDWEDCTKCKGRGIIF